MKYRDIRSDFDFDEQADHYTCPNGKQLVRYRRPFKKQLAAKTPAYRRSRRQRKQVEMLFAHMKRIMKVDRLSLRGLSGAQDEFLLTATAQNLRRMTKYLGTDPPVVCGIT